MDVTLKLKLEQNSFMGLRMEAELRICKLCAESDSEALAKLHKEDPENSFVIYFLWALYK